MASVGYATLQVIPSMRGFRSAVQGELNGAGLDQLGRTVGAQAGESTSRSFAGTLGSGLRGAFSQIGETLATGFRVATTAAVGLGAAFGGVALTKGLDRLTTIQDATASLTITLGSAAKAGAFMNEILAVVKGTPFNLDQFATAGKNLVAFNIDAAKVPGILTAIGEAAAASGRGAEGVDRIVDAFGKISAQGKVSLDALYTISDAGVNALAILGNGFGVTTGEMRDMISAGAVPAAEAIDILTDGIVNGSTGIAGATVALGGSMAGLRETLSGAFGGAEAAVARFGAAFLGPFVGPITEGLQSVTGLLDGFAPRVQAFAQSIADSEGFGRFTTFISDLPAKLEPVLGFIRNLGPALGPLAGLFLSIASTNLSGLLGPLGGLVPVLGPIAGILGGLVVSSPQLRAAFSGIFQALAPLVAALGSGLAPILASVADLVGRVAGALLGPFGRVLTTLTPILTKVADTLGKTLSKALDKLAPVIEDVAESLGGAFGDALVELAPILPPLAESLGKVAVAVGGALSEALTNLAPILPKLVESLGKVAVIVGEDLATALTALAPAIPSLANLVVVGADLIAKIPPDVLAKIVEAYLLFKGVSAVTGKVGEFSTAIRALADTPLGNIAGNLAGKLGELLKLGVQRIQLRVEASVTGQLAEGATDGFLATMRAALAQKLGLTSAGSGVLGAVAMRISVVIAVEIALEKITGTDPLGFGKFREELAGLFEGQSFDIGVLVNFDNNAILQSAGDLVDGLFSGIEDALSSAGGALRSIFYDGIVGAFKDALGIASPSTVMAELGAEIPAGILLGIVTGASGLAGWFLALPGQIAGWVTDLTLTLFPRGVELIFGLFSGIGQAVPLISGFLAALPGNFVTWVGDTLGTLVQKGIDVLTGLRNGFESGVGVVTGWLGGLKGRLVGAVGNAADWFTDVGRQIMRGLYNGLDAAKDRVFGLVEKIVDKLKDIPVVGGLFSSPSPYFIEVGEMMMKGLANGVTSGGPGALGALTRQLDALKAADFELLAPTLATIDLSTAIPATAGATATGSRDTIIRDNNIYAWDAGEALGEMLDQAAFDRAARGY